MTTPLTRMATLEWVFCYYGRTHVHVAAKRGPAEVIRALCELGADVNTPVKDGVVDVKEW